MSKIVILTDNYFYLIFIFFLIIWIYFLSKRFILWAIVKGFHRLLSLFLASIIILNMFMIMSEFLGEKILPEQYLGYIFQAFSVFSFIFVLANGFKYTIKKMTKKKVQQ